MVWTDENPNCVRSHPFLCKSILSTCTTALQPCPMQEGWDREEKLGALPKRRKACAFSWVLKQCLCVLGQVLVSVYDAGHTFHWDCRQWRLAQGFASHSWVLACLALHFFTSAFPPWVSAAQTPSPSTWHQDSSLAGTVQPSTTITHYQILMINLLWATYNLQVILSLWLNPNSENLYQMISTPTVRDSPGGPVFKTLRSQCRGPRFHPCSGN